MMDTPPPSAPVKMTLERSVAWARPDGIVHLVLGGGDPEFDGRILEADAIDTVTLIERLQPEGAVYTLVDMREVVFSDARSRRVGPAPRQRAAALLIRTRMGRMIARAYLGVTSPPIPIRIFEDTESAVAWLQARRLLAQ